MDFVDTILARQQPLLWKRFVAFNYEVVPEVETHQEAYRLGLQEGYRVGLLDGVKLGVEVGVFMPFSPVISYNEPIDIC